MKLADYIAVEKGAIDGALKSYLAQASGGEAAVRTAMEYAVTGGGKRMRPLLVLMTAGLFHKRAEEMRDIACAVEFVHICSLILDDLPCMDDAELRHGQRALHRAYGEANAILAANSFLMLAFEILGRGAAPDAQPAYLEASRILAGAIGSAGMIGGQARELELAGRAIDLETMKYIHARKTGALFAASVRMPAVVCGASGAEDRALAAYAEHAGLAFQVTDDVLDVEGAPEQTGKDAGKDAGRPNFAMLLGVEQSRKIVRELTEAAKESLAPFEGRSGLLFEFAEFIRDRNH